MLLAVFAVHAQGLNYSPAQYLFLVVLTLLVSIGTVGVPGTATITATSLFAAAGLPIPFIAISQPISQIVDMGRTALNVAGAANNRSNRRADRASAGYRPLLWAQRIFRRPQRRRTIRANLHAVPNRDRALAEDKYHE